MNTGRVNTTYVQIGSIEVKGRCSLKVRGIFFLVGHNEIRAGQSHEVGVLLNQKLVWSTVELKYGGCGVKGKTEMEFKE